jgi:hypothetical protein
MFLESRYPKSDLLKYSKKLESFKDNFQRQNEDQIYIIEKSLFIWFYLIRKLLESNYKISDEVRNLKMKWKKYKFTWDKKIFIPSWFNDEYNFDKFDSFNLNLIKCCHKFIHSQVLQIGSNESWNWIWWIFVASDYDMYKYLYQFNIDDIIKTFKYISCDYVIMSSTSRNEDWTITIINIRWEI